MSHKKLHILKRHSWQKASRGQIFYSTRCFGYDVFNSSCWAAPKTSLDKLDVVHRRHLRIILGYKYPNIISNNNLYIKRCNTEPLSAKVDRSRWRMLGHVLRGPVDGPAYSSLTFAVNSLQMKGRVGRPQTNLFSLIQRDLLNLDVFHSPLNSNISVRGVWNMSS